MLRHRQKFHVSESHFVQINRKSLRQFAIAGPSVTCSSQPTFNVHFIDRHWFAKSVRIGPPRHPSLVIPGVRIKIGNHRAGFRGHFTGKRKRVGLQLAKAFEFRFDQILVTSALRYPRQENFPYAAFAQSHWMPPRIPIVKVAGHRHGVRVGSPHAEARSVASIHGS